MAICIIPQDQVYNSDIYDDSLNPADALTAANLEEDLNYIRAVLLAIHGGSSWNDIVPGNGIFNRELTAGDGLNGGGDLSADRTFSVDNTVLRTSGNQTIGGIKTFTGSLVIPEK